MFKKKKDDYSILYDEDLGYDPAEVDGNPDPEEEADKLRGTIASGTCFYCGADNGMKYEGNCFICSECHMGMDEDLYYRWMAGYDVETDDDSWDELY